MKMVRVTLDLPAATQLAALQKLATDQGCQLFRREDGTFVMRPVGPGFGLVPQQVPA
jgi:hypothetical protein